MMRLQMQIIQFNIWLILAASRPFEKRALARTT